MTKKNETTEEKTTTAAPAAATPTKRTVEQIDFSKPFAVLFHQTEARNTFEVVTGDNPDEVKSKADDKAAEIAIATGRKVAVFAPQIAVKSPPQKPKADDLPLNF